MPSSKKPDPPLVELNERSSRIMHDIIREFIAQGRPVGSKTLSDASGLGLSPATIRNEFAKLEDLGLLYTPHVSAGRLPTRKGLQLFIDGLMQVGSLSEQECKLIKTLSDGTGKSFPEAMNLVSNTLSGLSNHAGFVIAPPREMLLKHIEFIPLSPQKALAVMVDDSNFVENRIIELPEGAPEWAWQEAGRHINDAKEKSQASLPEMRRNLLKTIADGKSHIDVLTEKIVKAGIATLSKTGVKENDPVFILSGETNLLQSPDTVKDLDHLHQLLDDLQKSETLLKLVTATEEANGISIFIGADNKLFSMSGCSAIISPLCNENRHIIGAIGVVGPVRMNYGRIIPLVDYTSKIVNDMMEKKYNSEREKA